MSGWFTCLADILTAVARVSCLHLKLERSLQTSCKKQLQTWVWWWDMPVIPALESQKQEERAQGQPGLLKTLSQAITELCHCVKVQKV